MKNHIEILKFTENDFNNLQNSINEYLQNKNYNPISISCTYSDDCEWVVCIVVEDDNFENTITKDDNVTAVGY